MQRKPLIFSFAATLALGVLIYQVSFGYFEAAERSKAEGRLSLYRSSVVAALEQYAHLTQILARDTYVIEAAAGGDTNALNERLSAFSTQAGLDAIYLLDLDGLTVSASNFAKTTSFVGQNYAFRPYFKSALQGGQGRFYAIGSTTGVPGYFIADAVTGSDGILIGVIAIKKNFDDLETSWREGGEQIILTSQDGLVLLASDPKWRYRALRPLSVAKKESIRAARQFGGAPLKLLDWRTDERGRAVIAGEERLHLVAADLPHDWQLHYFASDDRAVARSWLATAVAVLAAGSLLIMFQVQRARRIGRALKRSEQEEAQLRETNAKLAEEINERKMAERRLTRAQNELERASRLVALGELSASVTHELGQPIAAMRNHLAAAEISPQAHASLTGHIEGLVDRMEGITRQLKFFASPQSEPFEVFDMRDGMNVAIELLAPNIEDVNAEIKFDEPVMPICIRGSRLRIEQVMTNLARNALDAVEDSLTPRLMIRIGQTEHDAWFEIEDNGHGLGQATLSEIQEPFVTTRASGRGLGLGLAISANIIKDHEGLLTAENAVSGGTVFRVTIPVTSRDERKGEE
ncbi:ATP-binding protein [Pseudopelagicola sp. nBUS_20]|uniref:ATP-binding protein n=1 Tax=Pseudopelagicola sp. nBUS_20 TaxID=3395317 RepID=UPI003EBDD7C0